MAYDIRTSDLSSVARSGGSLLHLREAGLNPPQTSVADSRRGTKQGPLIAGCVLLGVGIVFPFTGVDMSSHLHTLFILAGTVIVILYGILIIAVASVFFIAGSVALLEIDASLIFMVVLYLVNRDRSSTCP